MSEPPPAALPLVERRWLARAIALAETARHRTAPNPAVGCVIVRDGEIVGEGTTHPPGGHHAEAAALAAAGERAVGASAYVTLEPCAHQGRTPPCAPALADAGVRRVVHVHADPSALAGGGASLLRARGVSVDGPDRVGPVLHGAVAGQLEGFLSVVRTGRPHVTLKLAQTTDGALRAPDGRRWLTGVAARTAVHRWRGAVDAVLVGSGTVLADDPRLDVRLVDAAHQPRPVVLDRRLRTPPTAQVVARGALVLTGAHADPAAVRILEEAGATVEVVAAPDHHTWTVEALRALARHGIRSVLAEPGATLADALVADGLVDRVVLHVADLGSGTPRRAVTPPSGRRFVTERVGGAGADLVLHLRPAPLEEAA
ncbi:bifunctional diaminohydroxyphosphoribosylaminopyrimidine deaminase/5-amino-6-(5-phosphoribosylamino)uracil reductase RibD [Egicoccus halophilus]|uniref:Riboflavin biosynthesis protein RibD n=1 Tax=Egicoccus halophilus TaxID=1670830 RepID=A0A8J3ABB8_9ACTN|nr:bifunctional diaminohydroxyphosphoribosylaminopyrimidine deaminase/5-amino-6-(5-phosphoribosylamino)uracil reductase RibD [Egicoccus halophilus]GGI07458.1 riboflavin biosynthesis protein RibD [Egicoccus halophilus]